MGVGRVGRAHLSGGIALGAGATQEDSMAPRATTPVQADQSTRSAGPGRQAAQAGRSGRVEDRSGTASVVGVFVDAGRLSLADAAGLYAATGLAVFPCAPGAKRPLTRHGFLDASTDARQVARWWRRWPAANIGLATGRPDGFDVLDIDVHPAGSGFVALARARRAGLVGGWTHVVRTPSGGLHLYFPARDDGHGQEPWALPAAHVDFRGVGGYVIAPPSQVEAGHGGRRGYQLIVSGQSPRPVDAAAVRHLLAPAPRRPSPRPGAAWAGRSGERLAGWLAGQPEGNRNRALFWAACRQAEAGVSLDQARQVLGSAAARTGLGEREIEATVASAYRTLDRRANTAQTASKLTTCRTGL